MSSEGEITRLLQAARGGDREAMNELFPAVYQRLRAIARSRLSRRRPDGTLDTTALVHEAYLKLVDQSRAAWQDRNHFFAVASKAMRQILVDHARRRSAGKRGGDAPRTTFDEAKLGKAVALEDLLALDRALDKLEELDPRLSRVVELRFFGGLSVDETAEVLEVNPRTVKRDWRKARAVLYREVGGEEPAAEE